MNDTKIYNLIDSHKLSLIIKINISAYKADTDDKYWYSIPIPSIEF